MSLQNGCYTAGRSGFMSEFFADGYIGKGLFECSMRELGGSSWAVKGRANDLCVQ